LTIVIDASLALAWCLPGEATSRTEQLLERVVSSAAVASAMWPLEVANVLLMSERSGRITVPETAAHLELLGGLPVELDYEVIAGAFPSVLLLAREHRLTTYDASYLEVAMRRGIALASNDVALRDAAGRVGLEVL